MNGRLAIGVLGSAGFALLTQSCSADRAETAATPTYAEDVAPILNAHCADCHGASSPAANWSTTSYLSTIACVPSSVPATLPANASAPILTALGSSPHIDLLSTGESSKLEAWVTGGSLAFTGTVHGPAIIDPRSPDFHGALLRAKHWSPMLDANDSQACGRCHQGAPATPQGITSSAPGATACTSCHSAPAGPLACNTCHGNGARIYPPRDSCFFPGDSATPDAHAAHVESSAANAAGLPCSTCHPAPGAQVIGGSHGDGAVEVAFDPSRVSPEMSYDPITKSCTVSCHDRGGSRPRPQWNETAPMDCNSCHSSPPKNHFPGACSSCHAEANATGTALKSGPLHMNGHVDLGNGNGTCGACHGQGTDPWPASGAHPHHESPTLTNSIACASCHVVPANVIAPGHLDGVVEITFSGHAIDRGAQAVWNGSTCSQVACHGADLADPAAIPAWNDPTMAASACGACHGIPPSEHTTSTSCEQSTCHGSEIARDAMGVLSITASGRALHINGVIDVANP